MKILRYSAFIATLLFFANCENTPINDQLEEVLFAEIEFKEPISFTEFQRFTNEYQLEPMLIEHEFSIDGNETMTGFLPTNKFETESEYQQKLNEGMVGLTENLSNAFDDAILKNFRQNLSDYTTNNFNSNELKTNFYLIKSITASINDNITDKLKNHPNINYLFLMDEQKLNTNGSEPTTNNDKNNVSWLPEQSIYSINESQDFTNQRFVAQLMYWDDVSDFTNNTTYEQDFFLNSDPNSKLGSGTYLTENQNSWYPDITYAASNFPYAYLDTRFSDPSTEESYTIGCAKAENLQSYNVYITYIVTDHGTSNPDNGKISGQIGSRTPQSCYSTWCVFSSQTESIVSAWDVDVPGSGFSID